MCATPALLRFVASSCRSSARIFSARQSRGDSPGSGEPRVGAASTFTTRFLFLGEPPFALFLTRRPDFPFFFAMLRGHTSDLQCVIQLSSSSTTACRQNTSPHLSLQCADKTSHLIYHYTVRWPRSAVSCASATLLWICRKRVVSVELFSCNMRSNFEINK